MNYDSTLEKEIILKTKQLSDYYISNLIDPKKKKEVIITLDLLSAQFKIFNKLLKYKPMSNSFVYNKVERKLIIISDELNYKINNFINILNNSIIRNQFQEKAEILRQIYLEIKKEINYYDRYNLDLITKNYIINFLEKIKKLQNKYNWEISIYITTLNLSKSNKIYLSTFKKLILIGELLFYFEKYNISFLSRLKINTPIYIFDKIKNSKLKKEIETKLKNGEIKEFIKVSLASELIEKIMEKLFDDPKWAVLIGVGIFLVFIFSLSKTKKDSNKNTELNYFI